MVANTNNTAVQAPVSLSSWCPLCGVSIPKGAVHQHPYGSIYPSIPNPMFRKIVIDEGFLLAMANAAVGPDNTVTVHWGEPDKDGVSIPTFVKNFDPLGKARGRVRTTPVFPGSKPPVGINHANLGDALHRGLMGQNPLLHQSGRGCDCANMAKAALDLIAKEARR